MKIFILICCFLIPLTNSQKPLGSIRLVNPGLLSVFRNGLSQNKSERYSILVSTYNKTPNTVDDAYIIDRPGRFLNGSIGAVQSFRVDGPYNWAKEMKHVDDDVFTAKTILITDGADIKGKIKGHIYLANATDVKKIVAYDITTPKIPEIKLSYHYSDALFKKVSFAGGKDIVTCRVVFVSDVYNKTELVYFKRPDFGNEFLKPWKDTVLLENACDSKLVELKFSESLFKKWDVLYGIGMYTKQLNIIWAEASNGSVGDWSDPRHWKKLTLDKGEKFYDIITADVNNDKNLDLVVSRGTSKTGSVEVWELPENDFRSVSNYTRHVIDNSFKPAAGSYETSPWVVRVHYPSAKATGKPWIFVAGGSDGGVYYYVPLSQDQKVWKYAKNVLAEFGTNQVVSGLTVVDLDGDGVVEVVFSLNKIAQVWIYRLTNLL